MRTSDDVEISSCDAPCISCMSLVISSREADCTTMLGRLGAGFLSLEAVGDRVSSRNDPESLLERSLGFFVSLLLVGGVLDGERKTSISSFSDSMIVGASLSSLVKCSTATYIHSVRNHFFKARSELTEQRK